MKKFLRITAALAAVFAMVNFVACKDDDDDDDNGNGFENTYWVLEDDVDDEEGYTVSAEQYVYIKDSSTGTMYGADSEKVWEAVYELVGAGVTDSKTFEYTQKADFTYAIEGSSLKITYKDEAGKDVNVTATVAEDKTSFSLTDKDEETGEEYTMTYKKAAAAPKAATVTYTVKTTEEPTEAVTYSFAGLAFSDFPVGSLAGKTTDKNDKETVISSIEEAYSDGTTYLPYIVANNSEGKELWDVKGAMIRCGSGHFKLRFNGETKLSSCINYNGGATTDISAPAFTAVYTGTSKTVDRYIMVPVTKNGKVTVSYKTVGSAKGSTTCQLGLFSKAGTAIKVDTVDTVTATEGTLTADVTAAAEEVYLVFSRNGAGGGGVDIYSIVVE